MSDEQSRMAQTWQEVLKSTELRAMSGSLRQLENLIGKDNTTAQQLAEIILKDVPLTSRVLTVANSVIHRSTASSSNEGALTQAIVRIGFNGLRAICISVAIMDSFLKKMPNKPELMSCIDQSFNAAVHARNIAKKTGAHEEDVFIAGLMQNLGEMVFWCSTIPDSTLYKELLECAVDTPEEAFKKLSGMDFQDISKALATEWKLSDLLLESFGVNMTLDTRAVHLGRRIASASKDGWDSPAINKILQAQLNELGFDVMKGMKFMKDGADEAKALAASYDPKVAKQQASAKEKPSQKIQLSDVKKVDVKNKKSKKVRSTTLIRS